MIEWLQPLGVHHPAPLWPWSTWGGVLRKHDEAPLPRWLFWTYLGVSIGLVAMAGLMSGLTLGLMSLDELDLEVLKRSGTPAERKHARRIMPVIANEHFLLVTLLLFNALAAEALPIFLDKLVDPVSAVLLSVSVVLVIGEILPQAVCSRYGLQVGSYSALLVRFLMAVSSPVSWPIGKLLDKLLGDDQTALFRRAQLKALVGLHSSAEGLGGNLSADEISIITGALDLTAKTAWTAMTPINKVFMLPSDRRLDEATLQDILVQGHSRLPVHEPSDRRKLVGLILVKELVLVDPEEGLTAGHLVSRSLPCLPADTPLYQLLKLFESGGSHMAAVTMPAPLRPSQEQLVSRASGDHSAAGTAAAATVLSTAGSSGSGSLPRIRSGVIKAGDSMVYIEAQQQRRPLSPQGSWGVVSAGPASPAAGAGGAGAGAAAGGYVHDGRAIPGLCEGCTVLPGVREGDPVGIITIEDVIEELLQQEIIDETDQFVDNLQVTRVDAYALTTSLPPRLRKAYAQQFTPRVGRLVVHHPHRHDGHSGSSWGGLTVLKQQQLAPRAAFSNPTTPMGGTPLGGSPDGSQPSPLGSRLSDPHHHLPTPAMQQVPEQQQLPEGGLHNLAQGVRQLQGGGHLHPHLHLHHHTQQQQRPEAAGQDRSPGRWLPADAAADGGGGAFAGGGRSWDSNGSGRVSRFAATPRGQQPPPLAAVRGFTVAASSSSQAQGADAPGAAGAGGRERAQQQPAAPAGFGSVSELEQPLLGASDGDGGDG